MATQTATELETFHYDASDTISIAPAPIFEGAATTLKDAPGTTPNVQSLAAAETLPRRLCCWYIWPAEAWQS